MGVGGDNKERINILDPKVLLEYAKDRSDAGRNRLVSAVSGFFEETILSQAERAIASEILLNLIRQAEKDLRQALAERFAVSKMIPPDVAVFLANDDISVAGKVLLHSPLLRDMDLLRVIGSKGADHWKVLAQRKSLSPVVADCLIDTGDAATMLNLVANTSTELKKHSLKKLAKAALAREELQAPILKRPEVDAEIATDLYMVVSHALRQALQEKFAISIEAIEHALENLVQELCNEARNLRAITNEMMILAKKFSERNEITTSLMIRTLRRGQLGFFIALFAEKIGLTPQAVISLIQKDGGQQFVAACKYARMMKSEFASVFLLSRGIRTGDKVVDQKELSVALRHFDMMRDHELERLIMLWRKNPEKI